MTRCAIDRRLNWLSVDPGAAGLPVAVDAPTHREIGHLCDSVHRLDRTVAALARDAGTRMRSMIETRERRQVMDFDPGNWLGLLAGIGLELFVESQGVIELSQFGGNDRSRCSLRLSRCEDFREQIFLRGGHEAVAGHADIG